MRMNPAVVLFPEQQVLHNGRRATFLHLYRGEAIIRYWGDSHALAVPPDDLSPANVGSHAKPRQPLAAQDEPINRDAG
jgi:hypothetical protein